MLRLKGYNTVELSNRIELPNISDLIRMPFCSQVDIESLYKNAPSDMKNIINLIPLGNSKYISISTYTQLLTPKTTSAPRANWHLDGHSFKEDEKTTIHLLVSDCEAVTEFMDNDLLLYEHDENSSVANVEVDINKKLHLINPKKAESSKFITFDGCKHLHRAIRPSRNEFRFMFRVLESNVPSGHSFERSQFSMSEVYDDGIDDYSKIDESFIYDNKTKSYPSIRKENNKIEIFYN